MNPNSFQMNNQEKEKKRVIIFLDADCFEVQLWVKQLMPELIEKDVPIVVVNHDDVILSLNYRAKILGVKRGNGRKALQDARNLCGPNLIEIAPEKRYGKVDTFLPQKESDSILGILECYESLLHSMILERNSRDEFFIDVTNVVNRECALPYICAEEFARSTKNHPCPEYHGKPTIIMEGKDKTLSGNDLLQTIQAIHAENIEKYEDEIALVKGAILARGMVQAIQKFRKYKMSAGVGHSKLVAKLACSRNKPEGVCILTDASLPRMKREISFQCLPGFGGEIGSRINAHYNYQNSNPVGDVNTIEQILWASNEGANFESDFKHLMEESEWRVKAEELRKLCQFLDLSPVRPIVHQKTYSTCISFKDCNSIRGREDKIANISQDMFERMLYITAIGRTAMELAVKAEMKKNSTRLPSNFDNTLELELEDDLNPSRIIAFIWNYIRKNQLSLQQIWKIHLTARSILEEYEC